MNKPHYLHTIKESTQDLCEALTEDYRTYTIRSLKHLTSDYSKNRLASIEDGTANLMKFEIREGRKYYKIVQCEDNGKGYQVQSVNAFVDKNSGKVYKPASWKSPAKGVRYDLSDEINKAYCLNRASWAGGYLYKR